mmetsp:Transcript_31980/g.77913  ORF Transcript_31980/g.77913 Transcript_31980/m.77913 type:complete len:207 (+) Transcript_31980:306-926(+)
MAIALKLTCPMYGISPIWTLPSGPGGACGANMTMDGNFCICKLFEKATSEFIATPNSIIFPNSTISAFIKKGGSSRSFEGKRTIRGACGFDCIHDSRDLLWSLLSIMNIPVLSDRSESAFFVSSSLSSWESNQDDSSSFDSAPSAQRCFAGNNRIWDSPSSSAGIENSSIKLSRFSGATTPNCTIPFRDLADLVQAAAFSSEGSSF